MSLDKRLSRDLSPVAVKRSVLASTLQQPLTLYSAAAAVVGGAFAVLINPGALALGALGIGATVSLGSWLWEYGVQGDKHANNFVSRYRRELEERRQQALDSLVQELQSIGSAEGLRQVNAFRNKYDTFVQVLDRKLTPGELTHNRYLSIAEQVFLGGLDNLENAAIALKSISAIDIDHVRNEIEKGQVTDKAQEKQRVEVLKDRATLWDQQMEHINQLLLDNEKALTQLDHVSARIATVEINKGRSQLDLEDAMKELRRLIQRADNYSDS
ncbi:MAG: hypothetical protein CSH37_09110 [Thalassolituus sp.]|nr:MAG: hypothetical protein CSH37_09110 [Thalassolituus sp.]